MSAAYQSYIADWRRVLWDATDDQTKVDRIFQLADLNGLFDPARHSEAVRPYQAERELLRRATAFIVIERFASPVHDFERKKFDAHRDELLKDIDAAFSRSPAVTASIPDDQRATEDMTLAHNVRQATLAEMEREVSEEELSRTVNHAIRVGIPIVNVLLRDYHITKRSEG